MQSVQNFKHLLGSRQYRQPVKVEGYIHVSLNRKGGVSTDNAYRDICHMQGCGNTMPDLSDLVPFHSGQVDNFNQLVLGHVQNLYKFIKFCI